MLKPTPQHRMALIVGCAAMLKDICHTNMVDPDPLAFEMLTIVSADIQRETDALLKDHDDARFQAMWGDRGTIAQRFPIPTVHDAWAKTCGTGIDEGFDDLSRS